MFLFTTSMIGQELPRGFDKDELSKMPEYLTEVSNYTPLHHRSQLPGEVRSMAEWEELQGLIISWVNSYKEIQAEIVKATIGQCRIIIVCTEKETVKNYLLSKGIQDSEQIQYVVGKYNSIWVRDYGPNSVYSNDVDSLYFTDWIYNRPRYQDDTIARQLSKSLNLPLLETNSIPNDLVHTGGNYMSDGLGFAFSSLLVMNENGPNNSFGFSNHSEAEVDTIMKNYMGTKTYVKMKTLPYDEIHHIDMHMKILDEQNILVGRYNNNVADGAQINANVDYILSNFKNTFGKPFQIHYIPMPPAANGQYPNTNGDYRTYTNSVFVNKTIIVPFYEEKYDTIARRIYENLLPGYNVVGIDCNKIIPSLGAIHCITKEVGVLDPLMISVDQCAPFINVDLEHDRKVTAIVKNKSGIEAVWLYYSEDKEQSTWERIRMERGNNDYYTATLPKFDSIMFYYVEGIALSGKSISRPMTAPDGYFTTRAMVSSSSHNLDNATKVQIYPNPANAITCVDIQSSFTQKTKVYIYDASGKIVMTLYDGLELPVSQKLFFNAKSLTPGTYYLNIQKDNKCRIEKFVVIH